MVCVNCNVLTSIMRNNLVLYAVVIRIKIPNTHHECHKNGEKDQQELKDVTQHAIERQLQRPEHRIHLAKIDEVEYANDDGHREKAVSEEKQTVTGFRLKLELGVLDDRPAASNGIAYHPEQRS